MSDAFIVLKAKTVHNPSQYKDLWTAAEIHDKHPLVTESVRIPVSQHVAVLKS